MLLAISGSILKEAGQQPNQEEVPMRNARIELKDTIGDMFVKMAEGNPGAITVMSRMVNEGEKIDPQSFAGGLGAIMGLDTHEIYGSRIWMLYKDVCGEDIEKTLALLRAVQLGKLRDIELHHAIDFRGEGIDVDELVAVVKAELKDFGVTEKQPMQMHPIESSHIVEIGHDDETETLKVVFKGNDAYLYKEVSKEDFAGLMESESKGKYLRQMDVYSRGMKIDEDGD